jgi:hypothetical protein
MPFLGRNSRPVKWTRLAEALPKNSVPCATAKACLNVMTAIFPPQSQKFARRVKQTMFLEDLKCAPAPHVSIIDCASVLYCTTFCCVPIGLAFPPNENLGIAL